MRSKNKERLSEIKKNTFGTEMKIVEYNSNKDITIEFQDKYKIKVKTNYRNFEKGIIKNVYDKSICEVGYLGDGKYNHKDYPEIYETWSGMIKRCYDKKRQEKQPTYRNCIVCDKWHNFQNFAKWWEENIYECNNEKMVLDKDILIKGNKIYSPETCIIAP